MCDSTLTNNDLWALKQILASPSARLEQIDILISKLYTRQDGRESEKITNENLILFADGLRANRTLKTFQFSSDESLNLEPVWNALSSTFNDMKITISYQPLKVLWTGEHFSVDIKFEYFMIRLNQTDFITQLKFVSTRLLPLEQELFCNYLVKSKNLQSLSFVRCGDIGIYLDSLRNNTELISFEVSQCSCDLIALADCLNKRYLSGIKTLKKLAVCGLNPGENIFKLINQIKLEKIDLSRNKIRFESLTEEIAKNSSLTKLKLSNCKLSRDCLHSIVSMMEKNTTLKKLDISGNPTACKQIDLIKSIIQANKTFEKLYMQRPLSKELKIFLNDKIFLVEDKKQSTCKYF
jgi:hypothetical protein